MKIPNVCLLLLTAVILILASCRQNEQHDAANGSRSVTGTQHDTGEIALLNKIDRVGISSKRGQFEFHKQNGEWMIRQLDYWLDIEKLQTFLLRLHYIPVDQELILDNASRVEVGLSETSPADKTTVISLFSEGKLKKKYILGNYEDPEKGKLKQQAVIHGENATARRFIYRETDGTQATFLSRDNLSEFVQSMAGWIHDGLWPHRKKIAVIEIRRDGKTLWKLHRDRYSKPFIDEKTGRNAPFKVTELANQLFSRGGLDTVYDVLEPAATATKADLPCSELVITEFYGYRYSISILDGKLEYEHGLTDKRDLGTLGFVPAKLAKERYTWARFDGSYQKAERDSRFPHLLPPEQFVAIQQRISNRIFLIDAGIFDALLQELQP